LLERVVTCATVTNWFKRLYASLRLLRLSRGLRITNLSHRTWLVRREALAGRGRCHVQAKSRLRYVFGELSADRATHFISSCSSRSARCVLS
jgi:hypothetical protein